MSVGQTSEVNHTPRPGCDKQRLRAPSQSCVQRQLGGTNYLDGSSGGNPAPAAFAEHLGPIQVRIQVTDGAASLVGANHADYARRVARGAAHLPQMFASQGPHLSGCRPYRGERRADRAQKDAVAEILIDQRVSDEAQRASDSVSGRRCGVPTPRLNRLPWRSGPRERQRSVRGLSPATRFTLFKQPQSLIV